MSWTRRPGWAASSPGFVPICEFPALRPDIANLHHYVLQGYLRGFATEEERIIAVPLDRARSPFATSVKNVAA